MEKKKLRLGSALSFAFGYLVRFPKYILIPAFLQVSIFLIQIYIEHNIPFFKTVSQANLVADKLANPGRYTLMATVLKTANLLAMILISIFLSFIFLSGLIRMVGKWLKNKAKPEWKDYFTWNYSLLIQCIGLGFIFGLMIVFGFIFLVIPGVVFISVYMFAPYALLDQKKGIGRSMDRSSDLTKGVRGLLFILALIYIGLTIYFSFRSRAWYDLHVNYLYILNLASSLTMSILPLVLSYLYFDLSAQQDELDKIPKGAEEIFPPIPMDLLMHQDSMEK